MINYQKLENWKERQELKRLLDLKDPPKELFYRGEWNGSLFGKCAAVVGSRRMTEYGRRVTEMVVTELISDGYTIVSGFMYGVDQWAHRETIRQGGKTIAVLGYGITWPLYDQEKKLGEEIISNGGLLLSEWEEQASTLWTFPRRNRIVAALTEKTIVIEAAEKSGSLITARLAGQLHREVMAVPGMLTSRLSVGTNGLISEGKARMWLPGQMKVARKISNNPVLELLSCEDLFVDEMAVKLQLKVEEIMLELMKLQLSGQVGERGGKWFLIDVS